MSDPNDRYLCSKCGLSFHVGKIRSGNSYLCATDGCKVIYQEGWIKGIVKSVSLHITEAVARKLRNAV